ncbi:MAG: hypothetical protein IJ352_02435 [Muribaculaceae bacterium]|nr:hypothetical protein [Muribaculaceae bacterium]
MVILSAIEWKLSVGSVGYLRLVNAVAMACLPSANSLESKSNALADCDRLSALALMLVALFSNVVAPTCDNQFKVIIGKADLHRLPIGIRCSQLCNKIKVAFVVYFLHRLLIFQRFDTLR